MISSKIYNKNTRKYNKNTRKYNKNTRKYKLQFKIKNGTKMTKKDYRIKKNSENYNSNNCNINSLKQLESNLLLYKERIGTIHNNKYTIFPYCNERYKSSIARIPIHTKISKLFDKVNRPVISFDIINLFIKVFNSQFNILSNIKKSYNQYKSPKQSVEKFIDLIVEYIPKNNKKCVLIVTHSKFLSNLSEYLCDNCTKIIFDNLDIIQIIVNKIDKEIAGVVIRRFNDNYKLDDMNEQIINNNYINDDYISYFLMRHCVGCHNSTKNIFRKHTIKGYGEWAMCFEYTIDEINSVANSLNNIFNKYGGVDSVEFGSSVIFRAMLTSLLLYNILKNRGTPPNPN